MRPQREPDPTTRPAGRSVAARPAALVIAVVVVVLAVALALFWWWVLDDDGTAGPESGVTVDDLSGFTQVDPGTEVTVSAEVIEPAFEGRGAWIGDEQIDGPALLVLGTDGLDLSEGTTVRVTGTVEEFDATELAAELDLDDEGLSFDTQNVVVADRVEQIDAS